MSFYDDYVARFWKENPDAKIATEKTLFVQGWDFHATYNAERTLKRLNCFPRGLKDDGVEVFEGEDGKIYEKRIDPPYIGNGGFTVAIFPDKKTWWDFQKPMPFVVWRTG